MKERRDLTPSATTSTTFMRIETNLLTSTIRARKVMDQTYLDVGAVEVLAKDCQPRFKPDISWTIDAMTISMIDHHARQPLIELFKRFKAAGGKHILVGSNRPFVRQGFQVMAMNAGVTLKLFNAMGDIAEELNTAAKAKPQP